jgi:hypothetical protein
MPEAAKAAELLQNLAIQESDSVYWQAGTPTLTGAHAGSADIEATALAAHGLLKWGRSPLVAKAALAFLMSHREPGGVWRTTQATLWALQSLVLGQQDFGTGRRLVDVEVNRRAAGRVEVDQGDFVREIDLSRFVRPGANRVKITSTGRTLYQIEGSYTLSDSAPEEPQEGPLRLVVRTETSEVRRNAMLFVSAEVRNVGKETVVSPIVEVGLPAGFTPRPGQLAEIMRAVPVARYEVDGRRIVFYLRDLAPGERLSLKYDLVARVPVRTLIPESRAYPYYNSEQVVYVAPMPVIVSREESIALVR